MCIGVLVCTNFGMRYRFWSVKIVLLSLSKAIVDPDEAELKTRSIHVDVSSWTGPPCGSL
jgi:hypothetical protein